jgi:hypothetical protein
VIGRTKRIFVSTLIVNFRPVPELKFYGEVRGLHHVTLEIWCEKNVGTCCRPISRCAL